MTCWFRVAFHREIDCGELTVRENWSKPDSKLIHLPVVIFRATAAPKEPIVFLNGGPGGRSRIRTADEIRVWLGLLRSQSWTWQRDFVVIAQRGTNWTDSNLGCPALTKLWRRIDGIGRSDQAWRNEVERATVACAQGLALRHDLTGYNTIQSARDVAALRQALGVEAWSVYAVSYGTRFALWLMKNQPAGLRSVVLDSVYPPAITDLLDLTPTALSQNLGAVFGACALDPICGPLYRDLEASFESAIHRLREEPATIAEPVAARRHVFGPSGLVGALINLMYSSHTIGLIPEVVHGFAEYSETDLNNWLDELFSDEGAAEERSAEPIAEGAFMAIKCNDDHAFRDPEASVRAASAHPLLSEWLLERERAVPCAHWPVAAIATDDKGRVASAIPTILLVGAFDPATPAAYAEFAAATLARAQMFKFPASGHGILGSDRCASAITEAFLDDPSTRPAATCLGAARAVDFSPSFQLHAVGLVAKGEVGEAEKLLGRTLAYQEQSLRPDDPGIAVTLSVLGELFYEQARLVEAEGVLVRALAINGKIYGSDSLEAGKSAGRLALVYHRQGRTEQAASLYQRTLRILEREYGRYHADVSFYRRRHGELVSRPAAARP